MHGATNTEAQGRVLSNLPVFVLSQDDRIGAAFPLCESDFNSPDAQDSLVRCARCMHAQSPKQAPDEHALEGRPFTCAPQVVRRHPVRCSPLLRGLQAPAGAFAPACSPCACWGPHQQCRRVSRGAMRCNSAPIRKPCSGEQYARTPACSLNMDTSHPGLAGGGVTPRAWGRWQQALVAVSGRHCRAVCWRSSAAGLQQRHGCVCMVCAAMPGGRCAVRAGRDASMQGGMQACRQAECLSGEEQ